jgi:hypothetical protein
MKNHCTVCDGRLDIWERIWGRFDHAACRSSSTAKHPAPPGPYRISNVPTETTAPEKGLGIVFRDTAILSSTE